LPSATARRCCLEHPNTVRPDTYTRATPLAASVRAAAGPHGGRPDDATVRPSVDVPGAADAPPQADATTAAHSTMARIRTA
jgi:hypothetical protein